MGKNNHLLWECKVKKANAASLREEMANLREEMPRMRAIVLAQGERLSSQLRVLKKLRGESTLWRHFYARNVFFLKYILSYFGDSFFLISSSILINI